MSTGVLGPRLKGFLKTLIAISFTFNTVPGRFPMATPEELEANNDECAICWERMECARKLECGHLFHK